MTPTITYGSLCTGYDGLGEALQIAGLPVEPRWMAEMDPDVSQVLKLEYPEVRNVGDIKVVPWHLAPHVDIMSSGDPCQSISIAGRQLGREDPRFLWPWVREAYRAVRPGAIFFENVANIVSHDGGRTLAERHEHLRQDGYAVRWTVLGACAVGAPHHRHRYYAVAGYVGPGAPAAMRVGGGKAICGAPRSGGRFLLPSPTASDRFGPGRTEAREGGDDLRTAVSLLPTPKATDGSNGGPNQRDGAGNYYLPGIANMLPTPMAERSGNNRGGAAGREGQPVRPSLDSVQQLLPTPTASNAHGNDVNNRGELLLPGIAARPEVWGKYAEAVALWEAVTGNPAPLPTEPGTKGGRRLSPLLPEWMMGLRPGLLTGPLGRGPALKAAGNGVVSLAAAAAWKLCTAPLP